MSGEREPDRAQPPPRSANAWAWPVAWMVTVLLVLVAGVYAFRSCRAVPGDGAIPLERILGDVLDAGYTGVFDLELVGPRIDAEGARPATTRAAETLSRMLTKLGA